MIYLANLFQNKLSKFVILLISLVLFILSYVAVEYSAINLNVALGIKDIVYGLIIFLILISVKDAHLALFTIMVMIFSSYSEIYLNIVTFVISLLLILIGFVIHFIKYKPGFKFSKYSIGIWILFIGCAFGGLFYKGEEYAAENPSWPILLGIVCIVVIPLILMALTSISKCDFDTLADYMLVFSLLIIGEIMVFMTRYLPNLFEVRGKTLNLVWGVTNNIAQMLIIAMPFCIYKSYKAIKYWYLYMLYYLILFISLILMIAKAGIIIAIIGSIIIFIYMYFVKKDKKKCLISLISAISLGLIGVIVLLIIKPSFFSDYFSNYSFATLESRIEIYKSSLSLFNLNPLFGIGYYGSFNWYVDSWTGIQFAHNTFLEMMVVGGIFGTICLIYHLVDKYSRLLYHMKFEKFILLLSFSLVGLYGLIDVTYFLLPYTAVLIFQMLLSDTLVEESNPKWLINTK